MAEATHENNNTLDQEEAVDPETASIGDPPTQQAARSQDDAAPPHNAAAGANSPSHKAEDELDVALNGQEPTVKNLILAAIGVMKNRKARPDSKRISNWINRRYGRAMSEVEEELERLVTVGELARVDYKGSASFRIVHPGAKAKRRRRGTKPLGRTPSRNPVPLGGVFPAMGPPTELSLNPPTLPTSPSTPPSPMAPLTLRTLVIEMLGDSAAASIESGITVTTQFIAKAVEATSRNIYRAAVIGNLDLILAKEVESGCFIKVGEDQYRIPQYLPQFHHHHSILALNPPLVHPPPAPVPVQQLIMDQQARNALPPAAQHQPMPPPASLAPYLQSDEQRKNDLIAAKLFKMEAKSKSPSKKATGSGDKCKAKLDQLEIKKEMPEDVEDLPLTATRGNLSLASLDEGTRRGLLEKAKGQKKKKRSSPVVKVFQGNDHAWNATAVKSETFDDDTMSSSASTLSSNEQCQANSRVGSSRKKKSRKIFDPADHDQPARKRKALSPVVCSGGSDYGGGSLDNSSAALVVQARSQVTIDVSVPKPREGGCIYCGLSASKQRRGRLEPIIRCSECPTTVHPSCMDYSEDLIKKIIQSPTWQCTNCKTCHVCHEANDDDCMLFCDSCDMGYHMACHCPPLMEKPMGKWECSNCSSSTMQQPGSNSAAAAAAAAPPPPPTNKQPPPNTNGHEKPPPPTEEADDDENARFLPILPPHLHPHTGLLPENWEDYEEDPHIPDVSEWEPIQVRDFLSKKGFSDDTSDIFVEQEIDGRSLLLLHRTDVVASLGLKLGPALKLFSCIKKLQTRRNFPDY